MSIKSELSLEVENKNLNPKGKLEMNVKKLSNMFNILIWIIYLHYKVTWELQ